MLRIAGGSKPPPYNIVVHDNSAINFRLAHHGAAAPQRLPPGGKLAFARHEQMTDEGIPVAKERF